MTPLQELLGRAGTVLLCITLAGVVARRRYREWWSFALCLSFVTVHAVLIILWPDRYHRPALWMANEIVTNLLRFVMALELAYRTFRDFPGALARLRVVLLSVVGVTLVVVLAATPPRLDYVTFAGQIQPRVLNGSIWLFTAISGLILWYRLPVRAFHKKILLGYVPYLLIFTLDLSVFGTLGWERGQALNTANQVAYLLLVAYWGHAAWQPVVLPSLRVAVPLPR